MKRLFLIPILSAILAAVSALGVLYWQTRRASATGLDATRDTAWLGRELHLAPEQLERLETISAAYRARLGDCETRHCASRCTLRDRIFKPGLTDAEMQDVVADYAGAIVESERVTLNYFRDVNAILTHEQRKKYQALVLDCVCPGCGADGASSDTCACGRPHNEVGQ